MPIKKIIKKAAPKKVKEKLVGKVVHYFDHIKVAVVKLLSPIAVGDIIRIAGGKETDFEQKIQSMEVDHQKITRAKKGQEVGLTVKEKVHEGYKVYKL